MNKVELIADLKSKVVKVIKEYDPVTLNGGDKEYSFGTVIESSPGVFSEEDYSIRVIDEGLPTEKAGYVNKQPPVKLSDLEIGLGLLMRADPGATVIAQVSDRLFKIRTKGEIKLVTLTSDKKGILVLPAE